MEASFPGLPLVTSQLTAHASPLGALSPLPTEMGLGVSLLRHFTQPKAQYSLLTSRFQGVHHGNYFWISSVEASRSGIR